VEKELEKQRDPPWGFTRTPVCRDKRSLLIVLQAMDMPTPRGMLYRK
jgi:hypothetical protein